MSEDPPWTIGRLLQWTTDYFKKHESGSARLDAEVLLAECRGCQRIELYTAYDEIASDAVRQRFRELVRRRAAGEPVAYLVGRREFFSLPFHVTQDVLVPRPETELLVMTALDQLKAFALPDQPPRLLDVGTGSGIIAVCIARHHRDVEVTALDVSSAALEVARRNAEQLGVSERIEFLESDLLEQLPGDRRFEIIASNPPYVSADEYSQTAIDVRKYEPRLALVGGPTGIEVIRRLIPQAAQHLVRGGNLLIEVSPMIADNVVQLIEESSQFNSVTVMKDLSGLARIVDAQRKSDS